jgi:hypothetical protein
VVVQYLNEVIDTCQNTGLKAVATVCDTGHSSVKVFKLLGATKRKPLLRFHTQEIATVYNPSNLLNCTRNVFMKHDVQLKSEHLGSQLPVIAKWELDRPSSFCQLCMLTDTHLNPTVQSTVKLDLAIQVISHTVTQSLNAVVATGKYDYSLSYELYSVMKEEANENIDGYFSKLLSPESSCDQTDIILLVIYYVLNCISIYKLRIMPQILMY